MTRAIRSGIRGLASSRLLPLWVILLVVGLTSLLVVAPSAPVIASDQDNDGVPDQVELAYGMDMYSAFSDADAWPDGFELYVMGTSPLHEDSDGDSMLDCSDPLPLWADPADDGGRSTVTEAYATNLDHEPLVGTGVIEEGVNANSGEFLFSRTLSFGPSVLAGGAQITLLYRSGVTYDGYWGYNVFASTDHWLEVQPDNDVDVYWFGQKLTFDENQGSYTSPAACPFRLCHDSQSNEFHFVAIRGGMTWAFDDTTGVLLEKYDIYGNTETYTHSASGPLQSVTTAEGLTISVNAYPTGRIETVSGPGSRSYGLVYNCDADLKSIANPNGETTQIWQTHGSTTATLNHNIIRIEDPMGRVFHRNEYDSSDRVNKKTRGSDTFSLTYDTVANKTTIIDWEGNKREWYWGSPVPIQLKVFSNRNVNSVDPATWSTYFTYNSNYLRTKVVYPRGNSVVYTWDSNYCMTQKRMKKVDTAADSATNDLIWSYTYGTTYYKLKNTTDPMGNTITRTHNSKEQVTQVSYPTLTHVTPNVTVTESMAWNSDGTIDTFTDGEGNVTKYEYIASGNTKNLLWKVTKDYGTGRLNLTTTYGYNTARVKTSETDPDGNTWTYTVDSMARVTKETSPSSLDYETTYTFNSAGQLTAKNVENVDKDGNRDTVNPWWTTSYAYNTLGEMSSMTEEIAETVSTVTSRTTSYTHTGNGQISVVTLPAGNKTATVYDERGNAYRKYLGYTSSGQAYEQFTYDANGNLAKRKDGRGKEWEKTWDLFDRVTKDETPLGHYSEYTYDKNSNRTKTESYDSSDNMLAASEQTYDKMNRVYEVDRWLDDNEDGDWDTGEEVTTSYGHDKRSLVVSIIDPENNETEITYDAARRKTRVEDALGNQTNFSFDDDCCTATEVEEVEVLPTTGTHTFRTELVLDVLNRVTERRIVDRLNSSNKHIFKTKYTSLGIAAESEDAEGNKTWRYHDGLGRVYKTEVDLGSGNKIVTDYDFDANGNLISLTDDSGNETLYDHTARDQQKKIEYDDGETRTFTFNLDGSMAGWTDENGTVVANTYDDDGRLTARAITRATGVLGPTSESYTFDGLGRMTEAKNNNSTVQFEYDTLSRLVEETQGPNPIGTSGKSFTYTYDDAGNRKTCIYPSGYRLNYSVDAVGRWTALEEHSSSTDLVTMSYYGPGHRQYEAGYANGTTERIAYDGFRRLTDVDHLNSQSTVFAGFDYGYDKMSNPMYEARTHESNTGDMYEYDQAYRLTKARLGNLEAADEWEDDGAWGDYSYQKDITYSMDGVSNRTSVVEAPQGGQSAATSYASDSTNQYTSVGGISRSHDDTGNLTADGSYSYSYDYRKNLVKVMVGTSVVLEAEFDALGRRSKSSNGTAGSGVRLFYDGDRSVEEYNSNDNLLRKFVYGQRLDGIRCMISPDVGDVDSDEDTAEVLRFYYHHNSLGSVTQVTDGRESVVEAYEYCPYGETLVLDPQGVDLGGQSNIGNPYMFSSRRLDAAPGLYHFRRRAYSAGLGRFLQRDPFHVMRLGPEYAYARSRPTCVTDRTGLTESGKGFSWRVSPNLSIGRTYVQSALGTAQGIDIGIAISIEGQIPEGVHLFQRVKYQTYYWNKEKMTHAEKGSYLEVWGRDEKVPNHIGYSDTQSFAPNWAGDEIRCLHKRQNYFFLAKLNEEISAPDAGLNENHEGPYQMAGYTTWVPNQKEMRGEVGTGSHAPVSLDLESIETPGYWYEFEAYFSRAGLWDGWFIFLDWRRSFPTSLSDGLPGPTTGSRSLGLKTPNPKDADDYERNPGSHRAPRLSLR